MFIIKNKTAQKSKSTKPSASAKGKVPAILTNADFKYTTYECAYKDVLPLKDSSAEHSYLQTHSKNGYTKFSEPVQQPNSTISLLKQTDENQYLTYEEYKNNQVSSNKEELSNPIKTLQSGDFISYEDFLAAKISSGEFNGDHHKKNHQDFVKEFKSFNGNDSAFNILQDSIDENRSSIFSKKKIIALCAMGLSLILLISVGTILLQSSKDTATPFELMSFSHDLIPVKSGENWGYLAKDGKMALKPIYTFAEPFAKNGLALVYYNSKYNYINTKGEFLTEKGFSKAYSFDDNSLAAVFTAGKIAFINSKGEEVIPALFEDAAPYNKNSNTIITHTKFFSSNGLAPVKKGQYYCYIDTSGKEVINGKFQLASTFSHGLAIVRKEGSFGYINEKGDEVISCIYENALPFGPTGKAVVHSGVFYYIIDRNGKQLYNLPTEKNNIYDLYYYTQVANEDLVPCVDNGKFGYTDFSYNKLIEYKFDYALPFSIDGTALCINDGKLDKIDYYGNSILSNPSGLKSDPKTLLTAFMAGDDNYLPFIGSTGKCGFIDKKGQILISADYDKVYPFDKGGFAIVVKDNLYGIIDKTGKQITPCSYETIRTTIKVND